MPVALHDGRIRGLALADLFYQCGKRRRCDEQETHPSNAATTSTGAASQITLATIAVDTIDLTAPVRVDTERRPIMLASPLA